MEQLEMWHHGIKGMKWGVRRYQNSDGSLTAAGQKRYDRDKRENAAKKKDNRVDVSAPDPKRWVKEDLERSKAVVESSANVVKQLKTIEETSAPRRDLSHMSDKELRDQINRELLEQQYSKLFPSSSDAAVSKGRAYLTSTLDMTGKVLAMTGSALSIALAIKNLKG